MGKPSAIRAAHKHAAACGACAHPIVDAEGNPGYFGEACKEGFILLVAYCDAIGEDVSLETRAIASRLLAPTPSQRA